MRGVPIYLYAFAISICIGGAIYSGGGWPQLDRIASAVFESPAADEYPAAAEFPAAINKSAPPVEPKTLNVTKLDNGLLFPSGLTLTHFRNLVPFQYCFSADNRTTCDFPNPNGPTCLGSNCEGVGYVFVGDQLSSVHIQVTGESWDAILAASRKSYGEPMSDKIKSGTMESQIFTWSISAMPMTLTMAHFSGFNVYGQPILHGFTIIACALECSRSLTTK